MGWYLINEDERIAIGRGRMVGRDEFVDAPVLSREHLKFVVTKGQLTVRDLGSRNGTFLNGAPVTSEVPVPLKIGDVLKVRDYEFKVGWSRAHRAIGLATVSFVLLIKLLDPTSVFGLAIGFYGWAVFLPSAILATALATLVLGRTVPPKYQRGYLAAIFTLATALDLGLLLALSHHRPTVERVARARVEYHCTTNFRARQCINQIVSCPTCSVRIDDKQRLAITERLGIINRSLASPER